MTATAAPEVSEVYAALSDFAAAVQAQADALRPLQEEAERASRAAAALTAYADRIHRAGRAEDLMRLRRGTLDLVAGDVQIGYAAATLVRYLWENGHAVMASVVAGAFRGDPESVEAIIDGARRGDEVAVVVLQMLLEVEDRRESFRTLTAASVALLREITTTDAERFARARAPGDDTEPEPPRALLAGTLDACAPPSRLERDASPVPLATPTPEVAYA